MQTSLGADAVGDAETDPAAALASRLQRLRTVVDERKAALDLGQPPGQLPPPSGTLSGKWLALAALQVEKANDHLTSAAADHAKVAKLLSHAERLLQPEPPEVLPHAARYGRLVEQAYFTRDDSSVQPYFVYQPSAYDDSRSWPLVIFLHGWVPDTSRINPYLVPDFVVDLAERHGTLLCLAHGRTNTDFQYVGELDVLRVMREMKRYYSVDADRIYLLGISMGGAGAWQIGVNYPHLFAGIAPINGQADWFRFWHSNFGYPPRAELPSHLAWIVALNNPLDHVTNLSNLYSYSQHATGCFVGAHHTRAMVDELGEIGAPHDFFEDPSPLGHYIYWRPDCWARAFEHLVKQKRTVNPRTIQYTTYSLRFHQAYWLTLQRFEQWGRPAMVHAAYRGDHHFELRTDNVARLKLAPPPDWADGENRIRVTWNGAVHESVQLDECGTAVLDAPGWNDDNDARHAKTPAVCGPAPDVFNFPFIAVRGTRGTAAETAALKNLAQQFVDDWYEYAEGRVQLIRDDEVTDAMIAGTGLVLFGLPETNHTIARIHEGLPFKLSRETIEFPDGRTYCARENGLILTHPNPLAPERYVLVYNGLRWGGARSANHRFDRIPDFTVFREDPLPGIGSNRFLAAGLFDAYWRYDPDLTDFDEPAGGE